MTAVPCYVIEYAYRSAMEFVSNLESDDLSMDPEEFRLKLEQSEKELASTLT